MQEMTLKYGCNPHQKPAGLSMADGSALPFEVLNGNPGYINFLDALNAWQLVRELRAATGLPAAASFKHVSPAGTAVGLPMGAGLQRACFVDDLPEVQDSPQAVAYARARGADRLCSFGDWIALSDRCDAATARLIAREVSDGVAAPDYDDEALAILRAKRRGSYAVLRMDEAYQPPEAERREVYGITLTQRRNDAVIDESLLRNIPTRRKELPDAARLDLLVAMITLKYTQSNSVCFARDGQAIGVGAGQQSRVHCTRLAGDKADLWHLRQHEKALALPFREDLSRPERDNGVDLYLSPRAHSELASGGWQRLFTKEPELLNAQQKRDYLDKLKGVSLGSDAFFPFDDSILRAAESGVSFVAQPGGSLRDAEVIDACDRLDMLMVMTGLRLFHH